MSKSAITKNDAPENSFTSPNSTGDDVRRELATTFIDWMTACVERKQYRNKNRLITSPSVKTNIKHGLVTAIPVVSGESQHLFSQAALNVTCQGMNRFYSTLKALKKVAAGETASAAEPARKDGSRR